MLLEMSKYYPIDLMHDVLILLLPRMFKTDLSLVNTFKKLVKEEGWAFMGRGITSNTTAVAVPIAVTIFVTDLLITNKDKLKMV